MPSFFWFTAMLRPMSRVRMPMRLAKMLMNGKRETAPRRVAIRGFMAWAGLAKNVPFSATGFLAERDSSCSVTGIVSRKDPDV
jgi:hypothetical protein